MTQYQERDADQARWAHEDAERALKNAIAAIKAGNSRRAEDYQREAMQRHDDAEYYERRSQES